jgi:hypothetical protein
MHRISTYLKHVLVMQSSMLDPQESLIRLSAESGTASYSGPERHRPWIFHSDLTCRNVYFYQCSLERLLVVNVDRGSRIVEFATAHLYVLGCFRTHSLAQVTLSETSYHREQMHVAPCP